MLLQNLFTINSIIICMLSIQYPVLGFCPAKCSCYGEHNLRVSCINASLQEVPIQLNPEAKYINLTLNQITNVHYTLQFYTQVEIFDLSRNRIVSVGSKNFDALNQLRSLNLSQNLLDHLPKDAFNGLEQLTSLDLSRNRIARVHITAMVYLRNVINLDFSDNAIISFEDNIFRNLTALRQLSLKNNEIVDVPLENLMHLHHLEWLDLSGNLIEFIKNNSFVQLTKMMTLKIVGNVINDIDVRAFDGLPNLRYLDLADNNLTIVPTKQLSKLSNLSYLSMSGNSFTYLPPVSLMNLYQLREVHLSQLDRLVRIDSRAFVDNTFLQRLTLDQNPSCSVLPSKLFRNNPNLLEVSIRGNNLHNLEAAQLPLDHLLRLNLGNNPFVCNCSLLWLWRLAKAQIDAEPSIVRENNSSGGLPKRTSMDVSNQSSTSITTKILNQNQNSKPSHLKLNQISSVNSNVLILDVDEIVCNQWENSQEFIKRLLKDMPASDMRCPAHVATIIYAVISVFLVFVTGVSILYYICRKKNRKNAMSERKNVNERIVPQQVDKSELEHYLAAQEMENEYRALRHWEVTPKEQFDESEQYEECNSRSFEYDMRRTQKSHVVYV